MALGGLTARGTVEGDLVMLVHGGFRMFMSCRVVLTIAADTTIMNNNPRMHTHLEMHRRPTPTTKRRFG